MIYDFYDHHELWDSIANIDIDILIVNICSFITI